MPEPTICFIGGGNMASSLVGGLIASGRRPAGITVSDPDADRRQALAERFAVTTVADNPAAAAGARIVVLAVKPQMMSGVCREMGPVLADRDPLVISIAAGVRVADIARWLGYEAAIIRAMPNTPALLGSGATGLFANAAVGAAQRDEGESVMRAVGLTCWVDAEEQMDAVTAVSGSGPAYFFLLMEAMAEGAEAMGLSPDTARLLVMETAFGAAKMALESDDPPSALRERVTSPGGTTAAALDCLARRDFRGVVAEALTCARDRARVLADEQGGQ